MPPECVHAHWMSPCSKKLLMTPVGTVCHEHTGTGHIATEPFGSSLHRWTKSNYRGSRAVIYLELIGARPSEITWRFAGIVHWCDILDLNGNTGLYVGMSKSEHYALTHQFISGCLPCDVLPYTAIDARVLDRKLDGLVLDTHKIWLNSQR